MFTDDVPAYVIDLGNDHSKRWQEVIAHEKTFASRLVQEASSQFELVPELLRWTFASLYKTFGGFTGERSRRGQRRSVCRWALPRF